MDMDNIPIISAGDTITLTEQGEEKVYLFIEDLKARRKEILDAGKDTADETPIPEKEDILSDILSFEDENGEYLNCWGVTDHYDSYPICLQRDVDFVELELANDSKMDGKELADEPCR